MKITRSSRNRRQRLHGEFINPAEFLEHRNKSSKRSQKRRRFPNPQKDVLVPRRKARWKTGSATFFGDPRRGYYFAPQAQTRS
jgi:hypothetical protein